MTDDQRPDGRPHRAALGGAIIAMVVLGITVPAVTRVLPLTEGAFDILAWSIVAVVLGAVFGLVVVGITWLLAKPHRAMLGVAAGAFGAVAVPLVLMTMLALGKGVESFLLVAGAGFAASTALVGAAAAIGAGIALLVRGTGRQRLLGAGLGVGGLAAVAAIVSPFLSAGTDDYLVVPISAGDTAPTFGDPSRRGPFEIETFTYGGGVNTPQPEFAKAAARLETRPVDGSRLVAGWTPARTSYWGFGPDRLPIDGRVWLPRAPGKYPLVLIIHGSHSMLERSDTGLAYLAELLASRGFVAAVIDENFFNLAPLRFGGLPAGDLHDSTGARAWLALEHARAFAAWNTEPGSALHGRIDLSRVGLIGHSRGGEAAAAAAALAPLERHPDDPTLALGYPFRIQAVVALAPTDGLYLVAGASPPLAVSFLTLHGAADNDTSSFTGSRIYQRVALSGGGYRVKASVFIDRANHGQFNTVWGRTDLQPPFSWLFNVRPLLSGEEQRRVAMVFVAAFLDVTLRGERESLPLLRDWRAGAAWLPRTSYRTQFEDSSFRPVATFEEDIDPATLTVPGGQAHGDGLSLWREAALGIRPGPLGLTPTDLGTRAVWLGWRPGGKTAPRFALELPLTHVAGTSLLAFSAACPRLPARDLLGRADRTSPEWAASREGIDLTLELLDEAGETARVLTRVPPPLRTRFSTIAALEPPSSETALQTVILPLADFVRANPKLDLTRLRGVRFVFDRSPAGMLLVDEVGFLEPGSGQP